MYFIGKFLWIYILKVFYFIKNYDIIMLEFVNDLIIIINLFLKE